MRWAVLAVILLGTRGHADSALKALVTGADSRGFEAVGRIEFAGRTFCTGSLIAEDLVLTAAHCLYDDDGSRYPAAEIRFLAGWRNGRATAIRGVLRALPHPDYATEPDKGRRIAHDLALLKLDQPVTNGGVHPFAIEAKPAKGAAVGVVSYAWDRAQVPSLQDLCRVLARQSGVLVLSCDIDFGSSGSPVFVVEDGVPHIVSVISAKAEADGRKVALGTDLQDPLTELKELMAAASDSTPSATPRVRRLRVGNASPAAGAKFLRP
jgi:V8-like Glu-specific endopeptidase